MLRKRFDTYRLLWRCEVLPESYVNRFRWMLMIHIMSSEMTSDMFSDNITLLIHFQAWLFGCGESQSERLAELHLKCTWAASGEGMNGGLAYWMIENNIWRTLRESVCIEFSFQALLSCLRNVAGLSADCKCLIMLFHTVLPLHTTPSNMIRRTLVL